MYFGSEYVDASEDVDEDPLLDRADEDVYDDPENSGSGFRLQATVATDGAPVRPRQAPPGSAALFASPVHAVRAASCSAGGSRGPRSRGPRQPQFRHHQGFLTEGASSYSQHQLREGRVRTADVNVVCIRFSQLVSPANMHTGDPVRCSKCSAIISSISHVTGASVGARRWCCDFCDHENAVELHPAEQPRTNDVTYMVAPPPVLPPGPEGSTDSLVIFCIDISGSMSVSKEVPGRLNLKGRQVLDSYRRFMEEGDGNQSLPRQSNRTVTHVTRLQAVQAAIEQQLTDLARDHPQQRPAIITFNNEVTFIGDGSCEPVRIAEHNLNNKEVLVSCGLSAPMPGPARATHGVLASKLFELEEGGRTALGPALVMAVAVAGKVPGSKIVLCTDGLANVGLGDMESKLQVADTNNEQSRQASEFYTEVGREAASKGVSISVVTILGTSCKLAQLSVVAHLTSGQVSTVDPLKLEQEFSSVLQEDVLATNAVATFIVHRNLYIEGEPGESMSCRVHHGNVKRNSDITFRFGLKKDYRQALRVDRQQTAASSATAASAPAPAAPAVPAATAYMAAAAHSVPLQESMTETSKQPAAVPKQSLEEPLPPVAAASVAAHHLPYPTQAHFASPVTVIVEQPTCDGDSGGSPQARSDHEAGGVTSTTASPCGVAPSCHNPSAELTSAAYSSAANTTTAATATTTCSVGCVTTHPHPHEVCFQIQVEYTDLAGGRALRVHTVKRPITTDRELSEQSISPAVISVHAEQQAGLHRMSGRGAVGRQYLASHMKLLSKSKGSASAMTELSARLPLPREIEPSLDDNDAAFAACYKNVKSHMGLYEEADVQPGGGRPSTEKKTPEGKD